MEGDAEIHLKIKSEPVCEIESVNGHHETVLPLHFFKCEDPIFKCEDAIFSYEQVKIEQHICIKTETMENVEDSDIVSPSKIEFEDTCIRNEHNCVGDQSIYQDNDLQTETSGPGHVNYSKGKMKKIFECPYCERIFHHRSNFNRHLAVHSKEKPFSCDVCQISFSRKGNLSRHIYSHAGEKNFKCQYCDKIFSRKQNLNFHVMTTHTLEKPYSCDYCSKSFARKDVLRCHIRTHFGDKPYKCTFCSKRFGQKSYLTHHVEKHLTVNHA